MELRQRLVSAGRDRIGNIDVAVTVTMPLNSVSLEQGSSEVPGTRSTEKEKGSVIQRIWRHGGSVHRMFRPGPEIGWELIAGGEQMAALNLCCNQVLVIGLPQVVRDDAPVS